MDIGNMISIHLGHFVVLQPIRSTNLAHVSSADESRRGRPGDVRGGAAIQGPREALQDVGGPQGMAHYVFRGPEKSD